MLRGMALVALVPLLTIGYVTHSFHQYGKCPLYPFPVVRYHVVSFLQSFTKMLSWLQPVFAILLFVFFLFASHYLWDATVRWLTVPTRVDSVQSLAKQYQRIYQQLGTAPTTAAATTTTVSEMDTTAMKDMKDELQDFLHTRLSVTG